MKKKNFMCVRVFALCATLFLFVSCQKETELTQPAPTSVVKSQELTSLSMSDLEQMQSQLESKGYDLGSLTVTSVKKERDSLGIPTKSMLDLVLRSVKVSFQTPNPNGSGEMITCSGVILIPHSKLRNYRIVVAAPPTYTLNSIAPSNFFKDFSLDIKNNEIQGIYLYLHCIQAACGYAVFIPDYAGFGDSFGKCFSPYVVQKPQAIDAIDFIKAGEGILHKLGYKYKADILVGGYSQGAFVATALARELETNPSYGINVLALAVGGTPCNLKQMVDIALKSPKLPNPMFLPYMFFGYKDNGYLDLDNSAVMKEPYASLAHDYFNGMDTNIDAHFPVTTKLFVADGMLASDFDTNPTYTQFNQVLRDNSLKPWKNKCKFVMYHGTSDVTVYYQQAKDFAAQQNAFGGKVAFLNVLGNHESAIVSYTILSQAWFQWYK